MTRAGHNQSRERWRTVYTLAVTGAGFPPIELYKIGQDYYVRDGHHRGSVARYLAWESIQAQVVEILPGECRLESAVSLEVGVPLCSRS